VPAKVDITPGIDLSDPVAFFLGDVGVTFAVHTNRPGAHERRFGSRLAVAFSPFLTVPGKRGHYSGIEVQSAYPLVGDKETSVAVQKAIVGLAHLGWCAGTAVSAVARLSSVGYGADDAGGGVDFADR
jgi:hypothetical protein